MTHSAPRGSTGERAAISSQPAVVGRQSSIGGSTGSAAVLSQLSEENGDWQMVVLTGMGMVPDCQKHRAGEDAMREVLLRATCIAALLLAVLAMGREVRGQNPFAPTSGATLEKLNEAPPSGAEFGILYSYWNAPDRPQQPAESDLAALHKFLGAVAVQPYPRDPMHGTNRGYDTGIRLALQIAGPKDAEATRCARKLVVRKDIDSGLRIQCLEHFAKDDAALDSIVAELREGSVDPLAREGWVVAQAILQKAKPSVADIEFIEPILAQDFEHIRVMALMVRMRWPNESYFPLARRLVESGKANGFLLLGDVDSATPESLAPHRDFLLGVLRGGIEDRRTGVAVLVACRKMDWIGDDELVERILAEPDERFRQEAVNFTCSRVGSDALRRLRREIASDRVRQDIDGVLRDRGESAP